MISTRQRTIEPRPKASGPVKKNRSAYHTDTLSVPVRLIEHALKSGVSPRGIVVYLKAKMKVEAELDKKDVPGWKAALKGGLLKTNRKNNRKLYPLPFKGWGGTKVVVTLGNLHQHSAEAVVSCIMHSYGLTLHKGIATNPKGPDKGTKKKRNPLKLKPTPHAGGISLSIYANMTGRSKSTASRHRKQMVKSGAGAANRRTILLSHAAGDEQQRVLPDSYAGKGYIFTKADGTLWKEITSEVLVVDFPIVYAHKPNARSKKKADFMVPINYSPMLQWHQR